MSLATIGGQCAPFGLPIMKFTLTYDGELSSNGRPPKKWDIRAHISPQLEELWQIHPVLTRVFRQRYVPLWGGLVTEHHHSQDEEMLPRPSVGADVPNSINVCEPIQAGGWTFVPLVRNSLALQCALKITFLRKEQPGKVYQGGDLVLLSHKVAVCSGISA